ncbi:MAG: glycosyltransferase family 2 protein [Clostridia bacterium]|nr:MAG: glycosyltransferase family 2 protein [Clostridia bacterium]
MPEVGVIIPAYNEGPRLGKVLEVVTGCPRVSQTVVVDDGSTDNTAAVAGGYPVALVRHGVNRGKGAAFQSGLPQVREMDIVLFLDADLVNLRPDHLDSLVAPLRDCRRAQMSIGTFKKGRWEVDLQQRFFSVLNGQRALSRALVENLPDLSWSRFGVEVLLSRFAAHIRAEINEVLLYGLTHTLKEEKFGLARGFQARVKMYYEALRAAVIWKQMLERGENSSREEPEKTAGEEVS